MQLTGRLVIDFGNYLQFGSSQLSVHALGIYETMWLTMSFWRLVIVDGF